MALKALAWAGFHLAPVQLERYEAVIKSRMSSF
jgi:hypothetical protein